MRVSFSEAPVVHEHLCRDDYSETEHRQTWYSKKELSAIKRDTKKTITWIMGGMNGNSDVFCPKGLEAKTPTNLRKHKLHKEEAIRTVLKAQENPSYKTDPEWVAKAYATYSAPSMQEAVIMAATEWGGVFAAYYAEQDGRWAALHIQKSEIWFLHQMWELECVTAQQHPSNKELAKGKWPLMDWLEAFLHTKDDERTFIHRAIPLSWLGHSHTKIRKKVPQMHPHEGTTITDD